MLKSTDKETGQKVIKFDVGGGEEFPEWQIRFNERIHDNDKPCPHAYVTGMTTFIIPRAVVSRNEGGLCETSICLDCILEAVEKYKGLIYEED